MVGSSPWSTAAWSATSGKREKPVEATARSTSSGVQSWGSVTSSLRGTMTLPAVSSENSRAPLSRPVESSRTPSAVERSTMEATSSALKAAAISSLASMPRTLRTPLAKPLRALTTGLKTREHHTRGGASQRTAFSGEAMEMFLGTISPATTCRPTTMTRAMTTATAWEPACPTPTAASKGSRAWAMAGSATTPRPVEHRVTPSWAVASMRETFCSAHRAVAARASPASASGSSWLRREEVTANSAPTKKALPARRMTVSRRASGVLIGAPPLVLDFRGRPRGPWGARGGG